MRHPPSHDERCYALQMEVQVQDELLARLPAKALRLPAFDPRQEDERGDAMAFVASLREAGDVAAEWLADPEAPRNHAVTQIVRTFARAMSAQAQYVRVLVAGGAGLRGREPRAVLEELDTAKARLEAMERTLDALQPRSGALALLEAATGILKGEAGNAMDDERALYDG